VALWDNGRRFFGLDLVELSVEDVLDALVGDNASGEGAATGSLQAILAVPLGQPEQAQAGAVGLLRMLARVEERLDELSGVRADGLSPAHEPFRRPLQVLLVRGRHVFSEGGVSSRRFDPGMGGDPLVLEQDLDGRLCSTDVDLLVDECVGDAVVVFFEFDVVVDVDAGLLPRGEHVGLLRERPEGWPVQQLEELAAGTFEVLHWPLVQRPEQFTDGVVQIGQAEEGAVAQARQNPALGHLDADLGFGLVLGLAGSRGDHRHAIVLGQASS